MNEAIIIESLGIIENRYIDELTRFKEFSVRELKFKNYCESTYFELKRATLK